MINEATSAGRILTLVDMIPKKLYLSGVEKAILCNDGTVQTMLSAVYGALVKVEVLHQEENDYCVMRWVRLVVEYSKDNIVPVCLAKSVINKGLITKNPVYPGFLTGIREQQMGIGQLISSIGINTKREIKHMYADSSVFARVYQISEISKDQSKIDITITETFPRMQDK